MVRYCSLEKTTLCGFVAGILFDISKQMQYVLNKAAALGIAITYSESFSQRDSYVRFFIYKRIIVLK